MNIITSNLLINLKKHGYTNQRDIAKRTGHSLGAINKGLKQLRAADYLKQQTLTQKAEDTLSSLKEKQAIILAAGFGVRMLPINHEIPKGLVEVKGQRLIERLIEQLLAAQVSDIKIVVGFQKEKYEYLMDKYPVKLLVNTKYKDKNNIDSLATGMSHMKNTFVVPCDVWLADNPFLQEALYAWYLVTDAKGRSLFKVANNQKIIETTLTEEGNYLTGVAYFPKEEFKQLAHAIHAATKDNDFAHSFWEEILFEQTAFDIYAHIAPNDHVLEINTYEDLRAADDRSQSLETQAVLKIAEVFNVSPQEVKDVTTMKAGMTNRSFLFTVDGKRYIMRMPGEGSNQLINRFEEAAVYEKINHQGICDEVLYIQPESGYKITAFMEDSHVCDPHDPKQIALCMGKLRQFHQLALKVDHTFDIFELLEFYEDLWEGQPSAYPDYEKTKAKIYEIKHYIDHHAGEKILSHIDANADNFLIYSDADGKEHVRLIDWEYAAMHDPAVDIAMFAIYSMLDRQETDRVIDIYYEGETPEEKRTLIYAYIAAAGLLWSNWCEYKRKFGIDFGDYSIAQYRYAKDYYKILKEEKKVL
ncbi:NTP transferase domain-containing protein [Allofustis seminis]|uniref:NTP transferase domain-containing protein n=1 Tax=Allofustis seminis TaxID=166939 RepID=UPI0003769B27|nr:NTP transferase domain-containing protein [Allofustis seminis]